VQGIKSIGDQSTSSLIVSPNQGIMAPIVEPEVVDSLSSVSPVKKHNQISSFQKAMNTLRTSGGKGTINSIGSSVGRQFQKLSQFNSSHDKTLKASDHQSSNSSIRSNHDHHFRPSMPSSPSNKTSLYIIGEKSLLKGVKSDQVANCEFFPFDLHDVKHVKQSFRKLLRACCPSSATNDPDMSFHKQIKASEWFQQMQSVLQYSVNIVDLLDTHGASVMVCLEDGWDIVTQLVSLAQLCLDPFYRTFHGFRTLIEKEWLAFGHRFTHRSNHTAATLTSGFAPVFLQFLDMVHQIMNQFPLSFEFNHHFIKFLAYHYVSCRFRTFLLDCEGERAELGWLQEDLKKTEDQPDAPLDEFEEDAMSSISGGQSNVPNLNPSDRFNYIGTSFWTYAEQTWNKSSIFYNFLYEGASNEEDEIKVLRPNSNVCLLSVWEYYTQESLAHGFSYDPEIVKMEKQRKEEIEATEEKKDDKKGKRRVCNAQYDCIPNEQSSSIALLLDQVRKLEQSIGFNPNSSWMTTWNKIEIPMMSQTSLSSSKSAAKQSFESLTRQGFILNPLHSSISNMNSLRKRLPSLGSSRLESGSNTLMYSHRPHRFEKCAYSKPSNCDHCRNVLWGFGVKTGMKCLDCNFNCHDKCAEFVSKNCSGFKSNHRRDSAITTQNSIAPRNLPPPIPPPPVIDPMIVSNQLTDVVVPPGIPASDTFYDTFNRQESSGEHITYQGYLNKKGNLLKNWKQRWFQLDSIKHEVSC
jgi:myotubularin-related protein 5/13